MGVLPEEKTVYILGAGFSYEGKIPLQSEILNRILDFEIDILSNIPGEILAEVVEAKKSLEEFLKRIFSSQPSPTLEDVFTLLDQIISKRGHCFGYSWIELDRIRDALKRMILIVFHDCVEKYKESNDEFYLSLASHFIIERLDGGLKKDPFSIIALNWDSLVEDSIYTCLGRAKAHKKVDVDFCCYSSKIGKKTKHVPSILQKARNIHNIKVLKLHGSTNWLLCPNCNRLFTGLGDEENVWKLYVQRRSCRHCSRFSSKIQNHKEPYLETFIVTPTFVKTFDNTHIQMVWDNAYIELIEAKKVVFIGYSLPEADYHFRTLLRRSVRPGVPIEVVLSNKDKPGSGASKAIRQGLAHTRYCEFFGKDRTKFFWKGVKGYFRDADMSLVKNQFRKIARRMKKK